MTLFIVALASALIFMPASAEAYVGPGAGFAFITSTFFLIATFFVVLFSLLLWPIRFVMGWFRGHKAAAKAKTKRVIILGLDGMDPKLTQKFIDEGKLPHFAKLAGQGKFTPLKSSRPPLSPVAWTCFMTGANPGRNNIYDFLTRDPRTYLPQLSSAKIGAAKRTMKLGRYRIPLGKPVIEGLRKSKPFWQILGENGVFSTVIRVPITFPAERFNGLLLSGMCVPDLRGSQGTFSYYSTGTSESAGQVAGGYGDTTGGIRVAVERDGNTVRGNLIGPPDGLTESGKDLQLPFLAKLTEHGATLELPDQKIKLKLGEYSEWIRLNFPAGMGIKVPGIARFLLKETQPAFKLYVTPINIDPEKPALPISHPYSYSVYLAKTLGPYATLGLAEDTWALNEGVISDQDFLDQAYLFCEEREKMFFDALEKNDRGLLVCVFDTTDRIQHMFWRYLNPQHPALNGKDRQKHGKAIEDLYLRMDGLLGRLLKKLKKNDTLMVMSDHGFNDFSRGINLNSWLRDHGYLVLKENAQGRDWLADVDWSRTKAYAIGLSGMYVNLKGREAQGIVSPDDAVAIKKEIVAKLSGIVDPQTNRQAIIRVWDRAEVYQGPYVSNAPDLVVGFDAGYRVSWESAQGRLTPEIFVDNTKAWSGDHCLEPDVVPGILFTNFKHGSQEPHIMDLAPTTLSLLGVDVPGYMDGKSLALDGLPEQEPEGALEPIPTRG